MIRRPPRSTLFPTRRSSDLPLDLGVLHRRGQDRVDPRIQAVHRRRRRRRRRSEEHTSELQSLAYLVCRLLLEKKKEHTTEPPIQTSSCISLAAYDSLAIAQ